MVKEKNKGRECTKQSSGGQQNKGKVLAVKNLKPYSYI